MTLDFFYETLTKLDLIWSVGDDMVRCKRGDCPILAVHRAELGVIDKNEDWDNECWESAAEELELSFTDAELLIDAADSNRGLARPELLVACGL